MHVDAHGASVQKPEGHRPIGKGGHSYGDNIKMDFKSSVGVTWRIDVAWDRDNCGGYVPWNLGV